MCGNKVFGCFQPRQGLNVNLKENNERMNRMVGQDEFLLVGF